MKQGKNDIGEIRADRSAGVILSLNNLLRSEGRQRSEDKAHFFPILRER